MAASKAQMIPSIRAFIPAPAQHWLHCRGAFRPKDNYFFNVESPYDNKDRLLQNLCLWRISDGSFSFSHQGCCWPMSVMAVAFGDKANLSQRLSDDRVL